MAAPSLEAAKITVMLLGQYSGEENIEDAMRLDYKHQAPEDVLREHFAQHCYSEELQDDVAEFFFKVSKYRKFLEIIEKDILYKKSPFPKSFIPSSRSPVTIALLYLLLFELSECSMPDIKELIMSISKEKALMVLSELSKSSYRTKLYEWGSQIWDVEYVKEILNNALEKNFLEEVYETVKNEESKTKHIEKKKLTVPVGPKCLEYAKKFKTPVEVLSTSTPKTTRIPVLIRSNPIPSSTYFPHSNLESLQRIFEKNREEARKKYEEAQKNTFRCANVEKSEKFRKVVEQIEMERCGIPVRKNSWNKIKLGEVQYPKKTAAVILREGARILKLEQAEIKRYEELERGGFKSDQTTEWENEIREETLRKQLEEMEKKHLEILLSYEDALISRQKYIKKNKERADEFRKEKENWLAQLEMWRKEEQLRIQESFEKGKAFEKGAKEAMEHVKEEKHKIALETMEESRALKEKWLKEKEQDLQRKVQLIKEIKALQAIGAVRRKYNPSNEPTSLGLLYEMSLEELKERLSILKIEVQEELKRRRAQVKMKRECRKEIINTYQELIESHQKILQEQKQRSDLDVREEKVKTKPLTSSSSLDCLRRKLYEKRSQRMKHQIKC